MSGRLEAPVAFLAKRMGDGFRTLSEEEAREVLELIGIARAALRMRYAPSAGEGDVLVASEDWYALRAALARLDATTTEQP